MAFLFLAGCAVRGGPAPVGDAYDGPVARVLAKAGGNAAELRAFLDGREPGSPEAEAARFLVAGLPLQDAATLTALELAEHLDYALRARETFPWCADMPWDMFLRWVVPHRVAQERAQPWRKRLFEALRPEVLGLAGPSEAALAVNRWVARQAAYGPTGPVDQGPLDTIARGLGRCEELVILLVDALRAVGVAARPCGVAWWRHTNDNHVWVEVWDRGRWLPLGAGEVDSRPGLAWFAPWLHTVAHVHCVAYGEAGPDLPDAVSPGRGSAFVERTGDYASTGILEVEMADASGRAASGAGVFVSVFNYGALRPVTAIRTDGEGRCAFALGAGDYLLTAMVDGQAAHAFVSVETGGHALVRLRPMPGPPGAFLEAARWMRFPLDQDLVLQLEADVAALRRDTAAARKGIQATREAELRGLDVLAAACLGADSLDDPRLETPLAEAMRGTGRNIFELVRAWSLAFTGHGEQGRRALSAMLTLMEPKDLAAFRGLPLVEDVAAALAAGRVMTAKGWYAGMDAQEYAGFVLASRVEREAFAHWRAPLWERFGSWLERAGSALELARRVNRLAAGLEAAERFRLAPDCDPLAVLRAGRVASERDRAVLAAAVLRALGVPARLARDREWVEFHDGHAWRPLYPDDPACLGDADAAVAGRRYAAPARLSLRFTRGGKALGAAEVEYWRELTLCRFTEQGVLEDADLETAWAGGRMILEVDAGDWLLVTGTHGPGNQAFVRVTPLALEPGRESALDVPLDPVGAP